MGTNKNKTFILILAEIAILILAGTAAGVLYWHQQASLKLQMNQYREKVELLLDTHIKKSVKILNTLSDFAQNDKKIREAWLKKDRNSLLACSESLVKDDKNKYEITHFYFHDANGTCFLRVQDPKNYGDRIHKQVLDLAVGKKEPVYSLALGTFGAFSVRQAQSWFIDDKLAGFTEFAKRVENVAYDMKKSLGTEISFIINKNCISRVNWEEGVKNSKMKISWEMMNDAVITETTLKEFPRQLSSIVNQSYLTQKACFFEIPTGKAVYKAFFVPLVELSGREIGNILVMADVTKSYTDLRNQFAVLFVAAFLISVTTIIYIFKPGQRSFQ